MLDIIIPTYKDPEGLRRTLQSVCYPEYEDWVNITVIDDCSPIACDEVIADYPQIKYYRLNENRGPGFARQFGIEHTHEPYFTFIDCGDVLISKYSLCEIKDAIEENPNYFLFFFTWLSQKTGKISSRQMRSTQGWVYKRDFFKDHLVAFCTDSVAGYANEDIGFNRTCVAIIRHMERQDEKQYSLFKDVPIYKKIFHSESITNTNNYRLTRQIPGIAINTTLSIYLLEQNHIDIDIIVEELNFMTFSLYKNFLRCAKEDYTSAYEHWKTIRTFYFNTYEKYEHLPENEIFLTQKTGLWLKMLREYTSHPNIKRFLLELKENEECPEHYYNLRSE